MRNPIPWELEPEGKVEGCRFQNQKETWIRAEEKWRDKGRNRKMEKQKPSIRALEAERIVGNEINDGKTKKKHVGERNKRYGN